MAEGGDQTGLSWDHGTAYDFLASLQVIHNPGDFGLRPAWAAGIRSRLPPSARELFAMAMMHIGVPAKWIHELPAPKTAAVVLDRLDGMRPEEILPALALNADCPEKCDPVLRGILGRGKWSTEDAEALLECVGPAHVAAVRRDRAALGRWLDCWARPAEFGAAYRDGLHRYYESFFMEEERRIAPDVEAALERARELAARLPRTELFDELSQGIRVASIIEQPSLVLVPCYWCTPRILYACLGQGELIVLFGARPPTASLIPGDLVPANLLLALDALADPTRLAILRALAREPLTQAELARRLRLRPPTISHHLKLLRIAGLTGWLGSGKEETRYSARAARLSETCRMLREFLEPG